MEMKPDENNIYPNIGNAQNTENTADQINTQPPISIPQYSVPQYSVPQYTVPQYQEPQQNSIDNMQTYQPPTYQSLNMEPISQQQNINNQNQVLNNGECQNSLDRNIVRSPNSLELFSFFTWILFMSSKWDIYRRSTEIKSEYYRPTLYNRSFV